ncbi:transmembrane protein 80-like isoform X2 [Stegodyphus dumicola]|uniref:transmembrane protein 80-like isoform X2 n=1 Tax=Stegodyphus dumicola TaxID=202533 RepID=UPI0015B31013|nr:transmembrane protein 80-like isoform X2 [Stegodyphus dumicola]
MTTNTKDEMYKPFSSLSYQILLVIGWWYIIIYAFVETLLLLFKKVALLFFLFGVESVRNFLGQKGNLTERMLSVVLSLLLTVPVVAGVCYFLWWQTYVLMIDVILSVILLVFLSLQCLFSIFTLFTFKR